MARIRNIDPSLPARMQNLGEHEQNLLMKLPLLCCDSGRVELDRATICEALYPGPRHAAMPGLIDGIVDVLESEGWLARYEVDGKTYLRLIHWKQDQRVREPTPSRLPPSPGEPLNNCTIAQAARKLQGRGRNRSTDQSLGAPVPDSGSSTFFSAHNGLAITNDSIVQDLDEAQHDAAEDGSHSARIRAILAKAQFAGVTAPVAVKTDPSSSAAAKSGPGGSAEPDAPARLPSPAERHGLPDMAD